PAAVGRCTTRGGRPASRRRSRSSIAGRNSPLPNSATGPAMTGWARNRLLGVDVADYSAVHVRHHAPFHLQGGGELSTLDGEVHRQDSELPDGLGLRDGGVGVVDRSLNGGRQVRVVEEIREGSRL